MTGALALTVEKVAHSKLGASSAYRWMNCPGSPQLIRKMPADSIRSSEAAAQGTAAHEVGAACLKNGLDPIIFLNTTVDVDGRKIQVDMEMVKGVTEYVTFVNETLKRYHNQGAYLLVEIGLSSEFHPDAFGTSDAVIVVPNVKLIVVDLKYGAGIVVEPTTPQTKYYGYLVLENMPFEALKGMHTIELVIAQPRIPHPQGTIRGIDMEMEELGQWFHSVVIPAMLATEEPSAPIDAGPWCKFCPVKDSCPARQNIMETFDATAQPERMTNEQLERFVNKFQIVKDVGKRAEELMLKRAEAGAKFVDHKLVNKQSKRILKDGAEAEAVALFGDAAYETPELKSPAQFEATLGADGSKFTTKWAYSPSTGFTMAPRSDKRAEIRALITEYCPDI
jgi:hypothetical protein